MSSKKHRKKCKRIHLINALSVSTANSIRNWRNIQIVFIDDLTPVVHRTKKQVELLAEIQEIFKKRNNSRVMLSIDSGGGSI